MKIAGLKNGRIVRSSWLEKGGRRLDCNPYMTGVLEAREALDALDAQKDPLSAVTAGHSGGIYNGPMFRRNYVDSLMYGVPFLTSGSMLLSDLSSLPLLRKKDAESPRLSFLRLRPGMTMISCSGTIGRMCYVHPDMEGMWSSQDVLKVVPDEERIAAGYLYAFLSGKYGVPLVVAGTYGAIIQHIEAEHIANLPVPRLGNAIEGRAHSLIEQAARKRAEASRQLQSAVEKLRQALKLEHLPMAVSPTPYSVSCALATTVQTRLDAFFHSTYHTEVVASLNASPQRVAPLVDVVASVEEPNRFKRVVLDAESSGTPLFGTSAIFWNEPEPSYFLPRKLANPYIVTRKTLLLPRSGQLSGVIGRVVLPYGDIIGGAVSEDAIRINCHTEQDAGFLFVFLSSEHGFRQLKARAFGSSIPHLDIRQIGSCLVPARSEQLWAEVGKMGLEVSRLRGEAINLDRKARALVERAISAENV